MTRLHDLIIHSPVLCDCRLSVNDGENQRVFRGVQRRYHYFVGVVREITDALLMAGEMLK